MRPPTHFLSAALLFGALTFTAHAQTTVPATDVPRSISYQGMLSSADGTPFSDGEYSVTITLYGDEQGNTPVWQETYTTQVTGGIFNLYLGNGGKPLPGTAAMNAPLWIGTSVNGQAEMRPLTPLAASPYALNVPDRAITGSKIAAQAVTADKVNMDYISELRIDGQKVSSKGTVLNLVSTPDVPLRYDEMTQSLTIGRITMHRGNADVDGEKGAEALATNNDVWTMRGDGRSLAGGFPLVLPAPGDWLGTSNPVDLDFRVNNRRIMQYQQTGAGVPNIIGGDALNAITAATSQGSIIGAGRGHSIANGNFNTLSGGEVNNISQGDHNVIGGGESHSILQGSNDVIAGGYDHTINNGNFNTASGGNANSIASGSDNTIGGGESNDINSSNHSTIGGGGGNTLSNGNFNTAGGGSMNSVLYGTYGTVGGGIDNLISNPGGYTISSVTIGGGSNNEAEIDYTTISGGADNAIRGASPGTTEYSVIGGGNMNMINGTSNSATIGGGDGNIIANNGKYATIGGGESNEANAAYNTIAGGADNTITLNSDYASVGGGRENNAQGTYTTLPGGDLLMTSVSYGQAAMGFYNASRGTMPTRPTVAQIAASNDPVFMVGNGSVLAGVRSNAFEVSYNGHTSVYDVNGSGTLNPAITGGTFSDNVILAWGNIPAGAGPPPNPILPNSDFGVASVVRTGVGVYDIRITVTDPTGAAVLIVGNSVTATIADNTIGAFSCYNISATPVGAVAPNTFRVRITNSSCTAADAPFMFKVTGR